MGYIIGDGRYTLRSGHTQDKRGRFIAKDVV